MGLRPMLRPTRAARCRCLFVSCPMALGRGHAGPLGSTPGGSLHLSWGHHHQAVAERGWLAQYYQASWLLVNPTGPRWQVCDILPRSEVSLCVWGPSERSAGRPKSSFSGWLCLQDLAQNLSGPPKVQVLGDLPPSLRQTATTQESCGGVLPHSCPQD